MAATRKIIVNTCYQGSTKVDDFCLGSNLVDRIYLGDTIVFDTAYEEDDSIEYIDTVILLYNHTPSTRNDCDSDSLLAEYTVTSAGTYSLDMNIVSAYTDETPQEHWFLKVMYHVSGLYNGVTYNNTLISHELFSEMISKLGLTNRLAEIANVEVVSDDSEVYLIHLDQGYQNDNGAACVEFYTNQHSSATQTRLSNAISCHVYARNSSSSGANLCDYSFTFRCNYSVSPI